MPLCPARQPLIAAGGRSYAPGGDCHHFAATPETVGATSGRDAVVPTRQLLIAAGGRSYGL